MRQTPICRYRPRQSLTAWRGTSLASISGRSACWRRISKGLTRQSPWQVLTKNQRYTVEKERNVPYSTQLTSESLQFGVKWFRRCVGVSLYEVIENFILICIYSVPNGFDFPQGGFRHLAAPFMESFFGRFLVEALVLEKTSQQVYDAVRFIQFGIQVKKGHLTMTR